MEAPAAGINGIIMTEYMYMTLYNVMYIVMTLDFDSLGNWNARRAHERAFHRAPQGGEVRRLLPRAVL